MVLSAVQAVRFAMQRDVGDVRRFLHNGSDDQVALAIGDRSFEFSRRAETQVDEYITRFQKCGDSGLQTELRIGDYAVNNSDGNPVDTFRCRVAELIVEVIDSAETHLGGAIRRSHI